MSPFYFKCRISFHAHLNYWMKAGLVMLQLHVSLMFSFSSYNFVCQLRNHMTFVVDNLQQYFMADVLESQFSILIRSVEQSTNFEDLSIAHDNFLAAVLTHTFVNNKAVSIVGINQSYLIVNVILCDRRCYE